jgi:hypothetical protein
VPAFLAGAAHAGLPQSASVTVSPGRAGARPAVTTLQLSYQMQCGYPGPGPVRVAFPAGEYVPAAIASTAVLVNGKPSSAVGVAGRTVTVDLPARPQIMCDVIGPGKLTIAFTLAAGLGNPLRAGTYAIVATRQTSRFVVPFTLRA